MTLSSRAIEAGAEAMKQLRRNEIQHGAAWATYQEMATARLTAALAAEGMVLVPKEPTNEMGEAGIASIGADDNRHAAQTVADVYRAMLSAHQEDEKSEGKNGLG